MPASAPEPYRLHLLGAWDLRGPDGESVRSLLAQPKRLCLLAYLARRGEPVSRSTIVSIFWPESDEERARNALSQAVHYLRRSLSKSAVESVEGDRLSVPASEVWFDLRALLDDGEPGPDVVQPAAGEFMEGWNADDSQPLQEWLDGVRREVRERGAALQREAALRQEEGVAAEGSVASRQGEPAPAVVAGGGKPAAGFSWTPRRLAAVGAAGVVSLGMVIGFLAVDFPPPSPSSPAATVQGSPPATDVAVLMPQMIVIGGATPMSASSVHDEVLALLDALDGPRIVAVPWAESIQELRRVLAAVGGDDRPEWVLSVSVRAAVSEARVIGVLYRGPDYTVAGAVTRDYGYESEAEALLEVPREIAGDVVAEVQRVLGGGGSR